MIDSHCHLASEDFSGDLGAVIARAFDAGVTTMVTIGDTMEESKECVTVAEKYEHIFCTVGLHPHHAKDWNVGTAAELTTLARASKKVKAIGEIGLDYHYDFSPREVQREVFREQLLIARELKLPVVVHCRESVEDVWVIVDDIKPSKLVMHCCSERFEDVERFVKRGYLLSFTGIATFPKSEDIRRTIKHCPLESLMIETDAPYLAPIPHRGKRNEPAFVAKVLECVAEIKGVSIAEADRITTATTRAFFQL